MGSRWGRPPQRITVDLYHPCALAPLQEQHPCQNATGDCFRNFWSKSLLPLCGRACVGVKRRPQFVSTVAMIQQQLESLAAHCTSVWQRRLQCPLHATLVADFVGGYYLPSAAGGRQAVVALSAAAPRAAPSAGAGCGASYGGDVSTVVGLLLVKPAGNTVGASGQRAAYETGPWQGQGVDGRALPPARSTAL